MLVLGALALSIPAATLASGGGSAGDQQYTDPFAGTSTPTASTHTTTHAQTTTPQPTTSAAPPATVAPTTVSTVTGTMTGTLIADPSGMPTATAASGQLPYTGYDSWLAGGFGFAMVSAGLVLRRRTRRS
jgi:LPXTG-motif cell wall-anchored protein